MVENDDECKFSSVEYWNNACREVRSRSFKIHVYGDMKAHLRDDLSNVKIHNFMSNHRFDFNKDVDKVAILTMFAAHTDMKISQAEDKLKKIETAEVAKRSSKIEKPPGSLLTTLLGFFISNRLFERTFGQTIRDARQEYFQALSEGEFVEAKKLKRELNFSIIKMCIETVAGWPAEIVSSFFGKVFGKGE